MSVLTQAELVGRLAAGEYFLVPGAQAAGALRSEFDQAQRREGVGSWRPPAVHSWSQFTRSLWSSLILAGEEERILLNTAQEHWLWKAIVREPGVGDGLGSLTFPDSLAEMAAGAYRRAAEYGAVGGSNAGALGRAAHTPDTRTFAGWAKAFDRRCAAEAVLPAAQLEAALTARVQALSLPARLHMAGFGALTPARQMLVTAMQAAGTAVMFHELAALGEPMEARLEAARQEAARQEARTMLAADPQAELRMAAMCIAETARRRPGTRFAVLLPDPEADRGEMEAVLRATLAPELNDIEADTEVCPWSFPAGTRLGGHGVASSAMDLLRLLQGPLPMERISALLLSPYVGGGGDRERAAKFDAELRRRHAGLRPELGLGTLAAWRGRGGAQTGELPQAWAAELVLHLQRTEPDLRRALTRPRSHAAWSDFAREALRAAGWPGQRGRDNRDTAAGEMTAGEATAGETAAREAFDGTLDLVATLDFAGRGVNFRTWLDTLAWQVDHAAVRSGARSAPVQVLSLAEASGMIFDHALLLRATDRNWPAPVHADPLLPFGLQRSLGMPGTDFGHDRAVALKEARDLLQRCASLTVLHAAEDDEGRLRPSPLLEELGLESVPAPGTGDRGRPAALELVADDAPLPAPPTRVRGGAKVLQLQAACGFRAFAELRLQAMPLDEALLGLDARASGTLLHLALQGFWKEVTSRDRLRSMAREERAAVLERAIESAVAERGLQATDDWGSAYMELQRRRLVSLLVGWLDQEAERGPFRVLDTETEQEVTVGPLTLSVRVDRLDQVEDSTGQGVFFVDYKTGRDVGLGQWEGDRPDEPQLPLYALLPEAGELKGLAFARIRPGKEMRWHGYQSEAGILPGGRGNAVRDMELTVELWRSALTQLAQDFHDGRADVRPKSMALNCRFCGQRLLCRLDPASLAAGQNETEADAEEGSSA